VNAPACLAARWARIRSKSVIHEPSQAIRHTCVTFVTSLCQSCAVVVTPSPAISHTHAGFQHSCAKCPGRPRQGDARPRRNTVA
jgi:hypothetical protein